MQDLLDEKILRQKLETALAGKNVWLERLRRGTAALDDIVERLDRVSPRLAPFIADTSLLVDTALRTGVTSSSKAREPCSTSTTARIRS